MKKFHYINRSSVLISTIIISTIILISFEREKAEISHRPLRWDSMPIKYHIHKDCYEPIDREKCINAVDKSFETWEAPKCTSLKFEQGEGIEDTRGSFNSVDIEANKNIIVWIYKDWPYESNGLALTTITYDDKTGKIYDADIELNGSNYRFDVVENPPSSYTDIQNTITHEIGHLIGLDHSYDSSSAMYPTARAGEIQKRSLSQDDIDGVCEIYQIHEGCNCSNLAY